MRRRLPPMNSLRAFEAAARHQSFTKAAEELGVTQSAISKQVSLLEEHLGRKLFDRRHKSLEISAEGRSAARVISGCLDTLSSQLFPREQTEKQKIALLSDTDFLHLWLFPRLPRFEQSHPEVEISITTRNDLSDIRANETFDLAIAWGRSAWPDFEFDPLFTNIAFPVCAPDYLGPDLSLKGKTLLHDRDHHWWSMFIDMMKLGDIDPTDGPVYSQTFMCLEAAARGDGITIGDEVATRNYLEDGRLIMPFPLHLPTPNSYYLLAPKHRGFDNAPVRHFRDWLVEEAREHRLWSSRFWH